LLGDGAQQRVRQPECRERRIDDNLLGIGLGSNLLRRSSIPVQADELLLRVIREPALLMLRRGAAKRAEALTD